MLMTVNFVPKSLVIFWDLCTKNHRCSNHRSAVSASPKRRYIAELFDSSFSPKEFADNMALPEAPEVWKNGDFPGNFVGTCKSLVN